MKASRLVIALALVLPLAAGCKKDENKDQPAPDPGSGTAMAGSGTAMGSGSDMGSGSAAEPELMSKKGGNCPNLVATSTTTVAIDEKKWTVAVTVKAADKNAVVTIQERAKAFKDRHKAGADSGAHDGKGGKDGEEGICPIAVKGLEVTAVKDAADGATLTLGFDAEGAKLDDAGKKAALAEVQARAAKAAEWMTANLKAEPGGQGGTGDGGGKHGRDHSGKGDMKGKDGAGGSGAGTGGGGGAGTGGGGGAGTGGGTKGDGK